MNEVDCPGDGFQSSARCVKPPGEGSVPSGATSCPCQAWAGPISGPLLGTCSPNEQPSGMSMATSGLACFFSPKVLCFPTGPAALQPLQLDQ